jgi:hypothetical protein
MAVSSNSQRGVDLFEQAHALIGIVAQFKNTPPPQTWMARANTARQATQRRHWLSNPGGAKCVLAQL